jgi:spore germination cell wall hydrolase CwlJ-like protein
MNQPRHLVIGPERTWWERALPPVLGVLALGLLGAGLLANVNRQHDPRIVRQLPPASSRQEATVAVPNLLKPLTPDQAVKENAERPFDAPPDTPAPKFELRADENSRDRAVDCLAQAVYYEAATEGVDGERAVAQVVLNRMRHPGFPSTVCGVVYQGSELPTGCQFTFTCDGSLARTPVPALWAQARRVAMDALAGKVFAAVGHATHYHADYVLPYWADSLAKQVQIGHHIFYRLKGGLGSNSAFSQRYAGAEPNLPPPPSTVAVAAEATGQEQALFSSSLAVPPAVAADAAGIAAAPVPKDVLLADNHKGVLLIDQGATPAANSNKKKPSQHECSTANGSKMLPAAPEDLHAGASGSSC